MNPAGPLSRYAQASWVHLLGLSALVLAVLWWLGPLREPILGDRAYFIYLGQAVLRGEPIYQNTFFGYPPLTPLLSAVVMWIGGWFGIPTYVAPRFAGMLVYLLCVLLAYIVTRRATGSAWAGLLSGVALASSSQLLTLSVSNLEPKILITLFSLGAAASLQRRWWGATGLASGLAGMCWQPAIVLAIATFAVTLWAGRPRSLLAVRRYALGMGLGILPAVLYLQASDSWLSFWQRAIVIPATQQLPAETDPIWWLKVMYSFFGNEWYFFIAAFGGFLAFILGSFRGPRSVVGTWLSPRMAGLPLLTLGWIAFNTQDFQGPPDMMPILAAMAFWVGWSGHLLLRLAAPWSAAAKSLAGLVLSVATVYGLGDAFLYEPGITLDEERAIVAEILQPPGANGIVLTFEATEVYVLDERPAPAGWSLNLGFGRFANAAFPDGCSGVQRSVQMRRPSVVVFQRHPWQTRCVRTLARRLGRSGYSRREVVLPWRRHLHYDPEGSEPPRIRWDVYTRRR